MSAYDFCFRACRDGPNAAGYCEHIYDVCEWSAWRRAEDELTVSVVQLHHPGRPRELTVQPLACPIVACPTVFPLVSPLASVLFCHVITAQR